MRRDKQYSSYLFTAVLAAVLAVTACFTGLCIFAGGFDNLARGAKLTQILHILDKEFVTEADLDAAADQAADGMIDSLGDKWSLYMTAEEYSNYLMRTSNNYRGIGVIVTATEKGFLIASVTRDSPAFEAGLKPEETIVSINSQPLSGKTSKELQEAIADFDGASFSLGVVNKNGTERSVTLSTAEVYTTPVSYEMLDNSVGYIVLRNFSTGCSKDAIAAIDDLTAKGVKSLIFDVRYNGGGFVNEMTALLDYLLPEGEIFISRDRSGKESIIRSDANCVKLKMAVLINADSYSAAELFAAQLSEFGSAVTVGEATTGKGRSQINYNLFDGSAIHISHEVYLTANRRDLAAEGGIKPEVDLPLSDEKKEKLYYDMLPHDEDEQLNAGIRAVS